MVQGDILHLLWEKELQSRRQRTFSGESEKLGTIIQSAYGVGFFILNYFLPRFTQDFNKYLLGIYSAPGTVLSPEAIMGENACLSLVLVELAS